MFSNELAIKYWSETPADNNIVEYFVATAKVSNIICNDEDVRINSKKKYYGIPTNQNVKII